MQLDDIKASVRPSKREEIDGLYDRFRSEKRSEDLDAFVAWLHEGGHISEQTFRGLHAGGKLVLTSFETLAESTYFPDESTQKEIQQELAQQAEPVSNGEALEDFDHPAEEEPTDEGTAPRFQFLGKLAAGAMGEIHIVRERELQRKVALKRMHANIAKKPKLVRRFFNEAQITAQLDHPNIVPVYSLDSAKKKPLSYTMKLIRGRTFAQLIHDTRLLYDDRRPVDDDHSLTTRLDQFCRACDALSYAHSRGVVHRDLKPENIMVGQYGEVYVMDWGIARLMSAKEVVETEAVDLGTSSVTKTRFGAVLGTPAYMSPEQAAGKNEQLDGRSDGFSLGLILHELVSLRPAVSGSDTMQILERMQAAQLDAIQHYSRRERIPPALASIIRKATRRRPSERYPGVKELAEDVRRFIRGEPVHAHPESLLQKGFRFIAAHRLLVLLSVLFVGGILSVVTAGSLVSALITNQRASVREAQLSRLLSNVSRQGHTIDTKFQVYQGLLKVVTATTAEAIRRDPAALEDRYAFYVKDDPPLVDDTMLRSRYVDRFAPSDLNSAPIYGFDVSLDFPNTLIAREDEGQEAYDTAALLTQLRGPMRRVLIESHDAGMVTLDPAEAERIVRNDVSPVQWVFVGLENGVGVSYPGHDGVSPGVDVRDEPWYEAASGTYAPVWGNPHLDSTGQHTLLPVSMGIYSDEGEFVGVAALDVSFKYIADNLLSMLQFDGVAEFYVLDEDGKILMSTREDERRSRSALRTRWLRRKNYENADVRRAIREQIGGYMEVENAEGDTDLVVWSRMGDLGWTYLVQGPRHLLME